MELTRPREAPVSAGPQETLAQSGVERILSNLAERLQGIGSLRRALLLGARARGEHHPRADIEIAVSMPGTSAEDWSRLMSAVDQTQTLLPIRVVRLETCDPEQRLLAETEGVLFFHPLDKPWSEFRTSLDVLGQSLQEDLGSRTVRDGILFRFSRTVDLFHRLLRVLLAAHGLRENGFKDALVLAYREGWIVEEERWLSLLQTKFWADRAWDDERIALIVEKIGRHHSLLAGASRTLASAAGMD
jgi:hypothetical protein